MSWGPVEELGQLGGAGTGNLLAFNSILAEAFLSYFVKHGVGLKKIVAKTVTYFAGEAWAKSRERRGKNAPKWLKNIVKGTSGALAGATSWKWQLELATSQLMRKIPTLHKMHRFAMQDRGWLLYAKFVQSTVLLFAATLPVYRHTAKRRLITDGSSKALIGFHCVMDVMLVTFSLIASSMAVSAHVLGNMILNILHMCVNSLLRDQQGLEETLQVFVSKAGNNPEKSENLHDEIEAVKTWAPRIFEIGYMTVTQLQDFGQALGLEKPLLLRICLGTVAFWILSAGIAKTLMPKRVALGVFAYINAAVCGPLYLLSEVDDLQVKKASSCVLVLIFLRAGFLCFVVGASCWSGTSLGAKLMVALIFNQVDQPPWLTLSLFVVVLYLASGYLAQQTIEQHSKLVTKAKEEKLASRPEPLTAQWHVPGRQSRRMSATGRLYPVALPPPPRKSQLSALAGV